MGRKVLAIASRDGHWVQVRRHAVVRYQRLAVIDRGVVIGNRLVIGTPLGGTPGSAVFLASRRER